MKNDAFHKPPSFKTLKDNILPLKTEHHHHSALLPFLTDTLPLVFKPSIRMEVVNLLASLLMELEAMFLILEAALQIKAGAGSWV